MDFRVLAAVLGGACVASAAAMWLIAGSVVPYAFSATVWVTFGLNVLVWVTGTRLLARWLLLMVLATRKPVVSYGAGFIGANFAYHCLRVQPTDRVVVLDALTYAGCRASLDPVLDHKGVLFVQGNIRDVDLAESILRTEDIDTLEHVSAESHADRSIAGPDAFIDINVVGTHAVLKAARRVWLEERGGTPHRFHHVSTDEVYGSLGQTDPDFSETTPYAPNSPYSASKATSRRRRLLLAGRQRARSSTSPTAPGTTGVTRSMRARLDASSASNRAACSRQVLPPRWTGTSAINTGGRRYRSGVEIHLREAL